LECSVKMFARFEQHRLFAHAFNDTYWIPGTGAAIVWNKMFSGTVLKPSPT
jgi:hypothetical protein